MANQAASFMGLRHLLRYGDTTQLRQVAQISTALSRRNRPLVWWPHPSRAAAGGRRYASASPGSGSHSGDGASGSRRGGGGGGIRVGYIFGGLVGLGLLVTTYGLLEYYYSLQTWPEPVRSHLKAALKARNRGDYDRTEVYFQKAIDAALTMPSSSLSPDPLQKLSGLYITYAALLESQGQLLKAYTTLKTSLEYFGDQPLDPMFVGKSPAGWVGEGYSLTQADHVRAIGLAQKLGHLALQLSLFSMIPAYPASPSPAPDQYTSWIGAAEGYLSTALAAMLKLGLRDKPAPISGSPSTSLIAGRDVELPEGAPEDEGGGGRVDKRGLGMTMEALSEVYAQQGKYDLASQLALQAISILIPAAAKVEPSIQDRCQAAMLMTNLSTYTLRPRTADAVRISKTWSLQALQVAAAALEDKSADGRTSLVCRKAKSVALHNMGMLAEIERDLPGALAYFEKSLSTATEVKFVEGRREAMEAVRRIRNQGISSV